MEHDDLITTNSKIIKEKVLLYEEFKKSKQAFAQLKQDHYKIIEIRHQIKSLTKELKTLENKIKDSEPSKLSKKEIIIPISEEHMKSFDFEEWNVIVHSIYRLSDKVKNPFLIEKFKVEIPNLKINKTIIGCFSNLNNDKMNILQRFFKLSGSFQCVNVVDFLKVNDVYLHHI